MKIKTKQNTRTKFPENEQWMTNQYEKKAQNTNPGRATFGALPTPAGQGARKLGVPWAY